MKIKKAPLVNAQNADEKKEKPIPPKQSFHDLKVSKKPQKKIEKKDSFFEVVSKEEKQNTSFDRKKETSGAPQCVEVQVPFAPIISGETPISASRLELTPEMTQFMEKVANFILVESQNGVTRTTVLVELEGSVLDGSQITLDHYDTAPHSFNVQLSGSPESIELFTTHLSALQNSIETHQTLQGFQIHILPPTLNENPDLYLREKKKKSERKKESKIVATKKSLSNLT